MAVEQCEAHPLINREYPHFPLRIPRQKLDGGLYLEPFAPDLPILQMGTADARLPLTQADAHLTQIQQLSDVLLVLF